MELATRNPIGTELVLYHPGGTTLTLNNITDLDTGAVFVPYSIGQDDNNFIITLQPEDSEWDRRVGFEYTVRIGGIYNDLYVEFDIYTPYSTPEKIREATGITETSKTDAELAILERHAAAKMDAIMGQRIAPYWLEDAVQGMGSDVLDMSRPLIDLRELYADDELIYDWTSDNAADFESEFLLTPSRYRLRKAGASKEHPYAINVGGYFGYDRYYLAKGVFGFPYVPTDLQDAASLFVKEISSNTSALTGQGVIEYSNDAYTVKYGDLSSQGTGNTVIDSVLAKYTNHAMVVV